jgi:regulation of enolase protein 1 (concanavalin A-like superfamily)
MTPNFTAANWIYPPKNYDIRSDFVRIETEAKTDFWQRSYYGFRNENAPALLLECDRNFTFTVRVSFDYQTRFDQCGVIIYGDRENWFKASIEYENNEISRLGSVVTNLGYSDWATTDIPTPKLIWYRLSRRGPDFLIESAIDGITFKQMRIFHLHYLGETSPEMGKADPPHPPSLSIRYGLYACSPSNSSFVAQFDNFKLTECRWKSHFSE